MDSLDAEEIESIWQREKILIGVKTIKSVSREGIQKEILQKLNLVKISGRNPQANSNFLIKRKFPEVASKNPNIRRELLKDNIVEVKVKGSTRFQIAKGTPTVVKDGKKLKAGQFLSGKTEFDATTDLEKRAG